MKHNLNPCAECGGAATVRGEAGIAVAACTQCGQAVGAFEAEDTAQAREFAAKVWNVQNDAQGGAGDDGKPICGAH